jgi:adenylate kinase
MNVLILGPQGSGKGTQAKLIASEYGLAHIATGDMLRAAIAAGTPLGERVKDKVERGELVPDDVMVELIRERLVEPDAHNGFVLDGFPRTLPQAEALDTMLRDVDRDLDVVLSLLVSDEVSRERMVNRAREEGRSDDTPEAIERRLARYHEETEPLIERYRTSGRAVGIHGERSVPEVFAEIASALEQVADRGGEPVA